MTFKKNVLTLSILALLSGGALVGCNDSDNDNDNDNGGNPVEPTVDLSEGFGVYRDKQLAERSMELFGFGTPLSESASMPEGYARSANDQASDLITLAGGLQVEYLTRQAGDKTDMLAFWPLGDSPTHLITCVEGGDEIIDGASKMNPSVQRIDLADGSVETILRGMSRCDGIRTTPWGTILATEESGDGGAYEINDPLSTSEHTVTDRAVGTIVDSTGAAATHIVKRDALPTMSWEGLEVLASGVVIGGDELRPGTDAADSDGGAIFKFVPNMPWNGTSPVTWPSTPLVAGSTYAMQVSCRDSRQQHGQGCEIGNAGWVMVNPATARTDADANGATGYYRPEDLHVDPTYTGEGVRFCWTNTGNEGAKNYAETVCGVDSQPLTASDERTVVVNRFVEGDPEFNSHDNFAFQPHTGIHYVIEDHKNGDVWACLPDGADRDIKTDGCVRMMSVVDTSAEPTGFIFSPDGLTAYVNIQHSADPDDGSMDFDNYGTDDLLKITGFTMPQ